MSFIINPYYRARYLAIIQGGFLCYYSIIIVLVFGNILLLTLQLFVASKSFVDSFCLPSISS